MENFSNVCIGRLQEGGESPFPDQRFLKKESGHLSRSLDLSLRLAFPPSLPPTRWSRQQGPLL